jgi:Fic family protein
MVWRIPPLDADTQVVTEDALAELARFDGEVGALAAPFAAILLRTESASSSEIEQLTAQPKGIALAELGRRSGDNARLIVANVRAMEAAVALAGSLDGKTIIEMQRTLLAQSAPQHTGSWRTQQVWIGGVGNSPHSARFVPPHHDLVPELMDDLVRFAVRTDLPAFAQIALAHAQFETIHPFPDGNGRTGRALVHAMLHRLGITQNVTVPVSAGLLQDTHGYFDALTAYRDGDVVPIVRAFAMACTSATDNGRQLVRDLNDFRETAEQNTAARRGSVGWRAIAFLQRQPVVDANLLAAELGVTAQNAQNGIDHLVADGILHQLGTGSRNRLYESRAVLDCLGRFAARSRRAPASRPAGS